MSALLWVVPVVMLAVPGVPGVLELTWSPPLAAAQIAGPTDAADTLLGAPPEGGYLAISTDPPGAAVYLDSIHVGTSPLVVRRPEPPYSHSAVAPGAPVRSILTIVGGSVNDWYAPVVVDTLPPSVAPGGSIVDSSAGSSAGSTDTLALHYALPLAARITSDPPGALVVRGDSVLGSTPYFAFIPRDAAPVSVQIRKEGYREEALLIAPPTFNYRVELVRQDSLVATGPRALAGVTGEGSTKYVIAAGIAVVSGTASALLKHKADDYYDDYLATGDPATLDRVKRMDLSSALSLAVTQLAIGYLVIELLLR